MWTMFLPIFWNTGSTRSNTSALPPTMIESAASIAPRSPPDTGASSISAPRASSAAAISRVATGEIELMSTTTAPRRTPSRMPFGPCTTSRTSGVSATIMMMMSLRLATSLGDAPTFAPACATSAVLLCVRFQTVTSYPAATRCFAIGRPMIPRPMNPIRSFTRAHPARAP